MAMAGLVNKQAPCRVMFLGEEMTPVVYRPGPGPTGTRPQTHTHRPLAHQDDIHTRILVWARGVGFSKPRCRVIMRPGLVATTHQLTGGVGRRRIG